LVSVSCSFEKEAKELLSEKGWIEYMIWKCSTGDLKKRNSEGKK